MLSTYCVNPAGKHFGMSHGRGGWHRACSVELICASEHQRRTYREEDLNTGAWPREEIRPACPLRSRGQLRGLYRGPSSRVRFWPLGIGIRIRLRTLAEGGRRIAHPGPAANVEFGDWTQSVGEGGVAAVHASNSEGVVFTNDLVRVLLAVRRQVAVG